MASPDSRPVLRVAFDDMWPNFDPENNFVLDALDQSYRTVLVSRGADILFYSVFGCSNLTYLGKKVLINPEIFDLEYGRPDHSIGFPEISDPNRLRMPNWAWRHSPELLVPSSGRFPELAPKFCNFVYSNDKCEFRNRFFLALNRRRPVDSLGRLFKNVPPDIEISDRWDPRGWQNSKISVLSLYRFTLAFENSSVPGYSTEKITHAFIAGSIPVYWGDAFAADDFNPKAFVNVHDFANPMAAIDRVLELDDSTDAQATMRSEAPMSEERWNHYFGNRLSDFLRACVETTSKPLKNRAYRAVRGALALPNTWQFRNRLLRRVGLVQGG